MIIWILDFLSENFAITGLPGSRLVGYVTFRALMAMLVAFLFGVFTGRKLINIIFQLNFRDKARDYGDIGSKNKTGTPTMGGIIIFLSFLVSGLMWGQLDNFYMRVILFASFWFTGIGFVDDYLKNTRGSSDAGMNRTTKMVAQMVFAVILAHLVLSPATSRFDPAITTKLFVPFIKLPVLDLSIFYYPFIVLVVIAISNSINFADGLDGLATVPASFVAVVYGVFAYIMSNVKMAEYLMFPYIPGAQELVVLLSALLGALAAFLWFNTFPAEIFMGDTGALFIGGVLATTAVLLKNEVLFLLCGGVFVLEFLSVFVQDYIGIKWLKRRIIYRAPIHHTYQFTGIGEPKIVVRFWIIAIIFTLISLISIKLR